MNRLQCSHGKERRWRVSNQARDRGETERAIIYEQMRWPIPKHLSFGVIVYYQPQLTNPLIAKYGIWLS